MEAELVPRDGKWLRSGIGAPTTGGLDRDQHSPSLAGPQPVRTVKFKFASLRRAFSPSLFRRRNTRTLPTGRDRPVRCAAAAPVRLGLPNDFMSWAADAKARRVGLSWRVRFNIVHGVLGVQSIDACRPPESLNKSLIFSQSR